MKPGDELIFLPLGGSGEIGMNVNLYGCRGKWIMCDLGMTFGDPSLPGIELVLPDLQFIEDRREDLLGVLLTHGHEDHIGAIPYLAGDLGVPLYATPFTAGLIRRKLEDEGLAGDVKLNVVPMGGEVALGPFRARYVALAHSIPEGNGLVIDTPHGRLFHTGDWKLDDRPILGDPASAEELMAIGANGGEGTLALVGDSTNVFNPLPSGSESQVFDGLMQLVKSRRRGRVLVTTFASNATRLHTLGEVAKATGRRLVLVGRSLERILQVAKATGYLRDFPEPMSWEAAASHPPEKLLLVATGTQGEPQAALARIAEGTHPIKLEAGDLVVYSSKQIPGNELAIGRVQNALAARGIEIIGDRQAHVHVSGHPGRPELEAMYGWIRPRIAVPVHGERRHMEEHARIALEAGVPQAIVPVNGAAIRLAPGKPEVVSHEPHGRLVLDGDVILPADGATIASRRKMAWSGHMVVTLVVGGKGRLAAEPVVIAKGVPVEEDEEAFLAEAVEAAATTFAKVGLKDRRRLEDELKIAVRRVARQWTGKKPPTDVQIISV
ncbi:ribonuclease J [Sandaracinobacter sp. RS1-74]|uniref:ribonuclease J n=1 Tax=Sandaracinobacteroides sayramensis TaxID=2913411 RepID=UPI001EDA0D1F|nr:ribonuclease J [Sandaracinobacteroides sayramensis]MCG2842383.1 ribonuclease J [Sandaracinobacteroides sayramensis]